MKREQMPQMGLSGRARLQHGNLALVGPEMLARAEAGKLNQTQGGIVFAGRQRWIRGECGQTADETPFCSR